MSPINKVSGHPISPANVDASHSKNLKKTQKENSGFQKILESFAVNSAALPSTEIGRNKQRSKVIVKAVTDTIENPKHPYYSIGAEHREQMRSWIIEQLEPSHYFRS